MPLIPDAAPQNGGLRLLKVVLEEEAPVLFKYVPEMFVVRPEQGAGGANHRKPHGRKPRPDAADSVSKKRRRRSLPSAAAAALGRGIPRRPLRIELKSLRVFRGGAPGCFRRLPATREKGPEREEGLQSFHDHSRSAAAPVAHRGATQTGAVAFQHREQGYQDPRAGGSQRMA